MIKSGESYTNYGVLRGSKAKHRGAYKVMDTPQPGPRVIESGPAFMKGSLQKMQPRAQSTLSGGPRVNSAFLRSSQRPKAKQFGSSSGYMAANKGQAGMRQSA